MSDTTDNTPESDDLTSMPIGMYVHYQLRDEDWIYDADTLRALMRCLENPLHGSVHAACNSPIGWYFVLSIGDPEPTPLYYALFKPAFLLNDGTFGSTYETPIIAMLPDATDVQEMCNVHLRSWFEALKLCEPIHSILNETFANQHNAEVRSALAKRVASPSTDDERDQHANDQDAHANVHDLMDESLMGDMPE